MYRMMWDYFFPEEDDSQRRQVSCKGLFVWAFLASAQLLMELEPIRETCFWGDRFRSYLFVWKCYDFWNGLFKSELLRLPPIARHASNPVRFFSLLCPTVLISDIFLWDKRKFGEFQHQLDLEEQEGSLLVLTLLLLAAILSENTIFLGNQVQLYLRQQMSRVCKAYMVTTYRWVSWDIISRWGKHLHHSFKTYTKSPYTSKNKPFKKAS